MKKQNYFSKCASGNRYYFKAKHWFLTMLMFSCLLIGARTYGNNLAISGVTVNQGASTVTFSLSWNNSWYNTGTNAANWDAAWVFVKFRNCGVNPNTQFTHGLVNTTLSANSFNAGTTTVQPTLLDGSAVGIDGSPNNTGVMLTNATNPSSGTISATVTLNITNLPATGSLDVRVFGIEMVFVPAGAFMVGDGNGSSSLISAGSFVGGGTSSPNETYLPVEISSQSAITVYENSNLNTCPSSTCALAAAFPNGYNAFYIMKYEISQGQYSDFLNASNSITQLAHFPNSSGTNRNTITNTGTAPAVYAASRPDRACNFLTVSDELAYLDWAALRPLSELEYEKACRGTNIPVPFQGAWGSITGTDPAAGGISGTENGTETITTANANVNAGSVSWTSGDGGSVSGPLRCGIFATSSTTTQQQTGGGFYGAMDLSGNVFETYIGAVAGITGNVSATGISDGIGVLDNNGYSTNMSNWPNSTNNVSNYFIQRGGSFTSTAPPLTTNSNLAISNRAVGTNTWSGTRSNIMGGRGGR